MRLLPLVDVFTATDPGTDPHQWYRQVRDTGPVCRGGPGQWVVARYAHVAQLLRDPRLGVTAPESYHRFSGGDGPVADFRRHIMLTRDGDEHARLARLIAPAFNPAASRRLAATVDRHVDDLLGSAVMQKSFDAVREVALPLVVRIFADALGLPADAAIRMRADVMGLSGAFLPVIPPADLPGVTAALTTLRGFIGKALDDRAAGSGEDVTGRLTAELARPSTWLTRDLATDNLIFLYFAGFETTVNLLSGAFALLTREPWVGARLRATPELLPSAVEELVRYESPIQITTRIVREPVDIEGTLLRPGRVVHLLTASANHDERQFDRPDVFDPARTPNRHVGFGGGVHYCLGAALGRLTTTVLLTRLLAGVREIAPAGPVVRAGTAVLRGYHSVPVAVS
jgi:cytochrome P450